MKHLRIFFFAIVTVFFVTSVFAGDGRPKVAVQPSWVKPIAIDYNNTSLDNEAEDGYVDLHHEKQISLAQQSTFLKKAFRILSETGVQNRSQITVDFDPSYEQLTFHTVRIVRNGKSIDQLQPSRIKIIQQEKELDRSIYNGTHTAMLILEDLRKDDILEYSYTIKGFNPIFQNKYAENYSVKFDVPIYGLYYRLLVPKERKVTVANSLTDVKPTVTPTPTETVYEWEVKNERAATVEKSLPTWYDAYPMIMVSEYGSWREVNDWAMQLFPFSTPSPNVQRKAEEIMSRVSAPEKRLLAALRFVQDDVRYMGIEMGESSHRPHAPSQVLQQRFGDCKDKAYLLCTLLRAMNIEAFPVLINTSYKKTVASWLPSPSSFDHTTVCAKLNDRSYWFDATVSYQRGRLDAISYPDYQAGLVIKPGTDGFTNIPRQDDGKMTAKERFYVERIGGRAALVVTTTFSGSYADDIRYSFKSKSNREILKECKAFYAPYFKKLDADSLAFDDDEETGVFTTREYYTVGDFWKERNGKQTASLEPYLIYSVIKKPESQTRTMPFALSYPVNYEEDIEIHMPKEWPVTASSDHYATNSFVFDADYSNAKSDVVLLKYHYQNLKDNVAPNEVAEYLDTWDRAEKGIGFRLSEDFEDTATTTVDESPQTSRTRNFTIAYILLGLFAAGTFIYRRNKSQRSY